MNNYTKNILSISTISIFFLFLIMFWSMQPWFLWYHRTIIISALSGCFILFRFILLSKDYKVNYSIFIVVAFAFLVYFLIQLRFTPGLLGVFNFIRIILVFTFVMIMTKDEKEKIVTMTTTIYAWIMGISLLAYLFVVTGIQLPYYSMSHPDYLWYPPFLNYRLFIAGTNKSVFISRFQSIFLEPGQMSVILVFLVYINRYKLKRKSVLIIFISVLISLSLAGYVLLILGYLLQLTIKSKNIYGAILKIAIVITLFISMGFYYYIKNPDSIFSRVLLSRFELDERKGIRGNNRTQSRFNYYYETQFLTSTENILWGKEINEFERMMFYDRGGNMSYRTFLFRYGSITLILLFLMYLSIAATKPSRLGFGLLILYSASFIQATFALWEIQLFLFVGAVQYFYAESCSIKKNDVNIYTSN